MPELYSRKPAILDITSIEYTVEESEGIADISSTAVLSRHLNKRTSSIPLIPFGHWHAFYTLCRVLIISEFEVLV